MPDYALGQTVYLIQFFGALGNQPIVVEFLIAAIRQTDAGYEYSKYEDTASPYIPEGDLFPTIEDAVNYEIDLLNALIPTP